MKKNKLFILLNSRKANSTGFKLIELLLVIAIIGIIISIIFVSLSFSIDKARDFKTTSQMSQIPSKVAIDYHSKGAYDFCADENNFSENSGLKTIQDEIEKRGGSINCYAQGDNYCISTQLNTGEYYIVKNDKRFTSEEGCINATTGGGLGEGNVPIPSWPCGEDVTFTYNGSSVTYGTVKNTITGRCWLDRNLGATRVAKSYNDALAYGDLFQWGRLDDGHQVRTSGTTFQQSTTDIPGHNNFIRAVVDWRDPQNDNLWQGVNGINNPCPTDFRIPTEIELNTERESWSTNDSAGAFASSLKLPVAGYRLRFDGSLDDAGSFGHYLSSTVSDTKSSILYFWMSFAYVYNGERSGGYSVRCIKD